MSYYSGATTSKKTNTNSSTEERRKNKRINEHTKQLIVKKNLGEDENKAK